MVMPQMGYDMHEGKVVRWLKQEGEEVIRGEIIAEIETDKATVEYEAYTGGVMGKIVAEEGETIPVGGLIAVITAPGDPIPEELLTDAAISDLNEPSSAPVVTQPEAVLPESDVGEVRASPLARRLAQERGVDLSSVIGTGPGGRITEADIPEQGDLAVAPKSDAIGSNGYIKASPLAKRLARERGVDLADLTGTGPEGRIVEADVPEHAQTPRTVDGEHSISATGNTAEQFGLSSEKVELSRMRQAIARVTVDSKREAPHFYVAVDIDMTKACLLYTSDAADE